MIISVSRRTDIPAFHSRWFMERIRAGFCDVPNPFRPTQISRISLAPADVDCLVFWSKNPTPLLRYLPELDERGYKYYFQFTLNGYPRSLEPHLPPLDRLVSIFCDLAAKVGSARVVWRYDPILISESTSFAYHSDHFSWLAEKLAGSTQRVVISICDLYPSLAKRLQKPPYDTFGFIWHPENDTRFTGLMTAIATAAKANAMQIMSCAELIDLQPYGIRAGSCIDGELIESLFKVKVSKTKDTGQRPACGCVQSRDIGTYGTCKFGCIYCYGMK